jgi:hypothetical protein
VHQASWAEIEKQASRKFQPAEKNCQFIMPLPHAPLEMPAKDRTVAEEK